MVNEQQKPTREQTKHAIVTGHYKYLLQALAIAMQHVHVWRLAETRDPFTAKEIYEFALQQDKEHPLEGHQFYMVSREGAIGISPGVEYLTKWMFIPMEPGREYDFYMQSMMEDLEAERIRQEAIDKAVEEGLAAERYAREHPVPPPPPMQQPAVQPQQPAVQPQYAQPQPAMQYDDDEASVVIVSPQPQVQQQTPPVPPIPPAAPTPPPIPRKG